jgi:phosphatidylserine decarboxylase
VLSIESYSQENKLEENSGKKQKNNQKIKNEEKQIRANDNLIRLAIFMNVTNVHVNRCPLNGRVIKMAYKPGGLVPAYYPESKRNERLITYLKTDIGIIKIYQIAGILARRIIPYIKTGDKLKKGQRIGIIQFGSRVDLILPKNRLKILVSEGDTVRAGSTSLAKIIKPKN